MIIEASTRGSQPPETADGAEEYAPALLSLSERFARGWGRTGSCGPGWYPLLARLAKRLDEVDPDHRWVEVYQIKEKFGLLRIYIGQRDYQASQLSGEKWDELHNLVDELERDSAFVCEDTGEPGILMVSNGTWLRTLDPVTADPKRYRVCDFDLDHFYWQIDHAGDDPEKLRQVAKSLVRRLDHQMLVLDRLQRAYGELQKRT